MILTRARKRYQCTLCYGAIPPGLDYVYQRVTPWDHPENEHFSDYKVHLGCHLLWQQIGQDSDWEWPCDFRAPRETGDHLLRDVLYAELRGRNPHWRLAAHPQGKLLVCTGTANYDLEFSPDATVWVTGRCPAVRLGLAHPGGLDELVKLIGGRHDDRAGG